ncbi:hypothetical protein HanHA300_Chr17g0644291 [Helianthus annuus]|nr:hypothetical protein HanHA300_Chr17g0644291 [Helianthus annuus]
MEAHTSVLAKGAEHPNSHSYSPTLARSRARGVGDEAQCGALCTSHARIAESRLCIIDRASVVKHKGCKDQVVGDAAHDVAVMRMRARVHEARGWAHGAWVLLCRARLCIFDRARVVKHKGCKDQVVGDAAHDVAVMRMRARVHEARGWAHGAWVLLCRARRTRVSQCGATVWRARIGSQVTWRTPHGSEPRGRTPHGSEPRCRTAHGRARRSFQH